MDIKEIKIRKKKYTITDKDIFMNNGFLIQVLTKTVHRGRFEIPLVLTKKMEKELKSYEIDIIEDKRPLDKGVKKGFFKYKLTGFKSMGNYDNTKF